MTDNNEIESIETHCYTYEVTVLVQVLAPNKDMADARLDSDGGYVSDRSVKFIRSTELYNSAVEKLNKEIQEAEDSAKDEN